MNVWVEGQNMHEQTSTRVVPGRCITWSAPELTSTYTARAMTDLPIDWSLRFFASHHQFWRFLQGKATSHSFGDSFAASTYIHRFWRLRLKWAEMPCLFDSALQPSLEPGSNGVSGDFFVVRRGRKRAARVSEARGCRMPGFLRRPWVTCCIQRPTLPVSEMVLLKT